jgi:hypothetical protein
MMSSISQFFRKVFQKPTAQKRLEKSVNEREAEEALSKQLEVVNISLDPATGVGKRMLGLIDLQSQISNAEANLKMYQISRDEIRRSMNIRGVKPDTTELDSLITMNMIKIQDLKEKLSVLEQTPLIEKTPLI